MFGRLDNFQEELPFVLQWTWAAPGHPRAAWIKVAADVSSTDSEYLIIKQIHDNKFTSHYSQFLGMWAKNPSPGIAILAVSFSDMLFLHCFHVSSVIAVVTNIF